MTPIHTLMTYIHDITISNYFVSWVYLNMSIYTMVVFKYGIIWLDNIIILTYMYIIYILYNHVLHI